MPEKLKTKEELGKMGKGELSEYVAKVRENLKYAEILLTSDGGYC